MFDPVDYINLNKTNILSMSNKCSTSVAMLINHGYWHTNFCDALFPSASETLLIWNCFVRDPQYTARRVSSLEMAEVKTLRAIIVY